ncbi:MAG: sodium:calcium antiporter [Anaerolineae bacterium]|jgi:cation:H+ antiporter|nr:sodium:calcium antiporter [Chloroflexota bacterium]
MLIEWIGTLTLPWAMAVGVAAMVLLVLSSNLAVQKLVDLAVYLGLSATFMGMTVVSLATSIPEITAHVTASAGILSGTLDFKIGSAIVLGSNIGSDVVQQTVVLGLVVWMARTLYFRRYFLWKSMIPMIASTALCLLLGWDGIYSRLDGAILFGIFLAYTWYLYRDERRHYHAVPGDRHTDQPAITTAAQAWGAAALTLLAMTATVLSAQMALGVIERVVNDTGVGGSLIGVVTLGIASALPELTTALAGARRDATGISLGTLVGSNITNPLVAIGLGSLVSTFAVPRPLLVWDLPWEMVTGALLMGFLLWRKGRIGRIGAFYFISLYAIYVICRALFFAVD